jgi:Tol biopolymer transport system component
VNRRTLINLTIATLIVAGMAFSARLTATAAGNSSAVERCAAAAPSNKLTYISVNGKQQSIAVTDEQGASNCFVNLNKAFAFSPSWSPNGKTLGVLIYDSTNASAPEQWLYTISSDASVIKPIVMANEFAWSPDGQQLAYTNNDGDIWVVAAAGGKPRNFTNRKAGAFSPSWSRDGKLIAYSQPDGIYVADAATGANARNLTNSKDTDLYPIWSPNGQFIAFTSTRSGVEQIYVVNVAGGAAQLVSDGKSYNVNPVWSPKSDMLAFVSAPSKKQSKDTRIMLVSVNGSNLHRLTKNTQVELSPAFSYDGTKIAYEVNLDKRDNRKIFITDLNGTAPHQIIKAAGSEASPVWMPS